MDDRSLPRRRVLARGVGALGIAAGLSGCVEEVGEQFPPNREWPTGEYAPALPTAERSDVVESGIEAFEGREIGGETEFEDALEEYGIAVEAVEREQRVLTVEYVATDLDNGGTLHDVGPIAGAYAALVGTDYEAEFLEMTILDDDSSSFGAAEVETSWVLDYNRGRYTAAEYGELVTGTIETRRVDPDVEAESE